MRTLLTRTWLCAATIAVFLGMIIPPTGYAYTSARQSFQKLVVSEIQTGGLTDGQIEHGRMEFIELYNPDVNPIDITGWRVEYLSAGHTGSGLPTRVIATLEGVAKEGGYILLSFTDYIDGADYYFGSESTGSSGFLAKSGGHVRIVDALGLTIDLVAWGTGVPIDDWSKVAEIPAGMSIQRILSAEDAQPDGKVFHDPSPIITPTGGGLYAPGEPPQPSNCGRIVISEILPNPKGTDSGREFIELYNPSQESVSLRGCTLRLGDAGKQYTLPDEQLLPNTYRAFSDTETGIVLPNATAQEVWLFSEAAEQAVQYAHTMPDDYAWALFDVGWQVTLQPTPGAANHMVADEAPPTDDPDLNEESKAAPVQTPCPPGKERNPLTNRCRSSIVVAEVAACRPGYIRNEVTNRCRKQEVATDLVPCKSGQERNPLSGRCRSVLAAQTSIPSPCPEGQERHPDTKRCRKKQESQAATLQVQDVRTAAEGIDARIWLVGLVLIGAAGYGVYEWRHEIRQVASAYARRRAGKGRGS